MRYWIGNALLTCAMAAFAAGNAVAQPPGSPGNSGKQHQHAQRNAPAHAAPGQDANHLANEASRFFDETRQSKIREYARQRGRAGFCPPGLAKKNNGCQPPGQARKWRHGERLPDTVRGYPVSEELHAVLGNVPDDYRLVRVANDLLLIRAGSRLVVDALANMGEGG